MKETLNNSEALYGFMAWLTTRDKDVTLGIKHDASIVPPLITEFIETNDLDEPRDNFADYLTHPK